MSQILTEGGGLKPNSNVPIIDVPKWLWRGGVRPNWDNVLKYGFLKASLSKKVLNVNWEAITTALIKVVFDL